MYKNSITESINAEVGSSEDGFTKADTMAATGDFTEDIANRDELEREVVRFEKAYNAAREGTK